MENIVSERIKFLLNTRENGNKAAFGRKAGITGQAVSDIIDSKKGGPSFMVLQNILKAYPDLSAEWLITGEGEMLKGQQPEGAGLISGTGTTEPSSAATERENALLRQQVAHLTSMLDWVKGLVPVGLGKLLGNLDAAQAGRGPFSFGGGAMAVPG